MRYLSIDIETTGLNPKDNQVLEVVGILEDTENLVPIEELPRFRILIKHIEVCIGSFCMNMHLDLFKEIDKQKVNLSRFDRKLGDSDTYVINSEDEFLIKDIIKFFLQKNNFKDDEKVVVAGKNFMGFDNLFIGQYFDRRISHRTLDPTPFFVTRSDKVPPNLFECAKRAEIPFEDKKYHTATGDAEMIIKLFRVAWNLEEEN